MKSLLVEQFTPIKVKELQRLIDFSLPNGSYEFTDEKESKNVVSWTLVDSKRLVKLCIWDKDGELTLERSLYLTSLSPNYGGQRYYLQSDE